MCQMKLMIRNMVFMVMATISLPCSATIYKCVDDRGNVSMQEMPCPDSSKSDEVVVKGSTSSLSPEDQAWIIDRKSRMTSMCIKNFGEYETQGIVSREVSKKICECGVDRYFTNPISKLRSLEDSRDIEGNKKLFRPAMTSCAKEIIDNQP